MDTNARESIPAGATVEAALSRFEPPQSPTGAPNCIRPQSLPAAPQTHPTRLQTGAPLSSTPAATLAGAPNFIRPQSLPATKPEKERRAPARLQSPPAETRAKRSAPPPLKTLHTLLTTLLLTTLATAEIHLTSWPAMGTEFRLRVRGEEPTPKTVEILKSEVERLEQILSVHRADSEAHALMRAANASPGEWVSVSPDLARVIRISKKISAETNGAFDITIGSLTRYWRHLRETEKTADPAIIERLKKRVDYRQIHLDGDRIAFHPHHKQILIDFGGIGKGVAADSAKALLFAQGHNDFLIEFGGEILAGKGNWTIEAEGETITLNNTALSTSGDLYHKSTDGEKSHVLSINHPEGLPAGKSITVQKPTSTEADAYATAARASLRENQ